jgi:hypothetical protein
LAICTSSSIIYCNESSKHARTKDELLVAEQEKRLAMEEIDTLREALQLAAVDVAAMKLKD